MLTGVLDYFNIRPDVDLAAMTPGQSLAALAARILAGLDQVIDERQPDCVVAQGDTVSVLAASLAAFYRRLPFVHVEAGLRTGDLEAPWPEEPATAARRVWPRRFTARNRARRDRIAQRRRSARPRSRHRQHSDRCAPLDGSTASARNSATWQTEFAFLAEAPLVLVTGHRRENFGPGLANLCTALARLAARWPEVAFVYPVHLNPNVHGPVRAALNGLANVHLIAPAGYPRFVWLMDRSTLVLTDSGGIQEEAPSLGKPVLVMRDATAARRSTRLGSGRTDRHRSGDNRRARVAAVGRSG